MRDTVTPEQKMEKLNHFPHIGGVLIEDDVYIGANACIDRGSLGDTIIGKGSKIDNLVHIAHNVNIGENVMIIANSMIAGSVNVGKNSWIAPLHPSSIKNQLVKEVPLGWGLLS